VILVLVLKKFIFTLLQHFLCTYSLDVPNLTVTYSQERIERIGQHWYKFQHGMRSLELKRTVSWLENVSSIILLGGNSCIYFPSCVGQENSKMVLQSSWHMCNSLNCWYLKSGGFLSSVLSERFGEPLPILTSILLSYAEPKVTTSKLANLIFTVLFK